MKAVKIAELKDHLSEHLRAVERGSEVVVTDRNRPIARIIPIGAVQPSVTITPPAIPFSAIRSKKHRPANLGVRSDALLAKERNDR